MAWVPVSLPAFSALYNFKCDQCEADYVGHTSRYLHQRTEEHKNSAIGKHIKNVHKRNLDNMDLNYSILRKCNGKFDGLMFQMVFIRNFKLSLNTQTESIKAKLSKTYSFKDRLYTANPHGNLYSY